MTLQPKQKFLLTAPVIVLPFLCFIFYTLGGGRAGGGGSVATHMGLNKQLPGAWQSAKQKLLDKLGAYAKADQDSAKKKEWQRRDPYRAPAGTVVGPTTADPKADELLRQLNQLQQSIRQPTQPVTPVTPVFHPYSPPILSVRRPVDTPESDPQLDRLNGMLDKVIRIQHPEERKPVAAMPDGESAETVMPADSAANAIAAVIPNDQTLVSGGTISLRLGEDVVIHGMTIPKGEWVYGTVSINNDRMLVHIRSLRNGNNLYNIELQVYDLDGLPGIHIPGMLSRDVAKESADEGINGLNLMTYDPSLGAQAANAGIQAGKTLFGRKVRLIRVSVKAGYQVLLRGSLGKSFGPMLRERKVQDTVSHVVFSSQPPGFVPGGSFLQRCRTEGIEMDLQGIYLQDSLLWIALRWDNHSPIGFTSDYCRWVIRDKRAFKRTAEQELAVEPVCSPGPMTVQGDSTVQQWTGFRPFALAKDKELVLEVGEKNGGRVLTLVIDHKRILKAKTYESHETTTE